MNRVGRRKFGKITGSVLIGRGEASDEPARVDACPTQKQIRARQNRFIGGNCVAGETENATVPTVKFHLKCLQMGLFILACCISCSRTDVPKEVGSLDDLAHAKIKAGDFAGAIVDSTRAIDLDPKSATSFFFRGFAKASLKDFKGAIRDYTQAVILNPKYEDAYIDRGTAKDQIRDHNGAVVDYSMAIHLNPRNASIYYYRGNTEAFALNDYTGAIADFTKSIEINPANAWVYNNRGLAKAMENKDLAGAVADIDKAIKLNSSNAAFYCDRGDLERFSEKYPNAIADFNQAIRLNPEYFRAYGGLGLAYDDSFELQAALTNFQKSLMLYPNQPRFGNRITLIRMQLDGQMKITNEVVRYWNTPAYRAMRKKFDAAGRPLPFSWSLVDQFLGNMVSENELFDSASNSVSRETQRENLRTADYYAGMKCLINGDKSGAADFLQKCVRLDQVHYGETGCDIDRSAEAELRALKKR
jgi:tetratricopeptide (TPR) repeat protein